MLRLRCRDVSATSGKNSSKSTPVRERSHLRSYRRAHDTVENMARSDHALNAADLAALLDPIGQRPRGRPGAGTIQIGCNRMQQRWRAGAHSFAIGNSARKIYVAKPLGLVSFLEPDPTCERSKSHVFS
jgi:hypothetical protein